MTLNRTNHINDGMNISQTLLVMFIAMLSFDPALQAGKLTEEEVETRCAEIKKKAAAGDKDDDCLIFLLEEGIVGFFNCDCCFGAVAGIDFCFFGQGEEFFSDGSQQL